jgi:4-amino-4-deoxy-L-arabinose transferase-like glycosyltransferase
MPTQHARKTSIWLAVGAIILFLLLLALNKTGTELLITWGIMVFCVTYVTWLKFPISLDFPKISYTFLITSLLVLVLFCLRIYWLYHIDWVLFHGDEALIGKTALNTFTYSVGSHDWDFFRFIWGTAAYLPAPWYYLQGFVLYLLGSSVFTTKLFSLVTDFAITLLIGILVKRWQNTSTAVAAVIAYSTLPIAIHFSGIGLQNIQSTFFLIGMIICLFYIQNKNSYRLFWGYLAGLAAGLGIYFYLSSIISPMVGLTAVAFSNINQQAKKRVLGLFALGYLVAAAPHFFHSARTGFFLGAREQVFIFNFSFTEQLAIAQTNILQLIGIVFGQSIGGPGQFYVDQPLFVHWLLYALFIIGVTYLCKLTAQRSIHSLALLLSLFFTLLLGGVITIPPIGAQRIIHIYPIVAICIALGIKVVTSLLPKKYSHFIFVGSVVFVTTLHLFSFFHDNIPAYQQLPKNELTLVRYLQKNELTDLPLVMHTPVHKIPQVYFYSNGTIMPIFWQPPTNEVLPQEDFLFLTNEHGLRLLPKPTQMTPLEFGYENLSLFLIRQYPQ